MYPFVGRIDSINAGILTSVEIFHPVVLIITR